MSANQVRTYEITLALADVLSQDAIDEIVGKIKGYIEAAGGSEIEVTPWGRHKLAYEIKGDNHAHFVIIKFSASGNAVGEIERDVRITDGVRRFQTCRYVDPEKVEFHYRDVDTLVPYITERGKIRPARATRLPASRQRQLTVQIKRARMLGLLPFTTTTN